MAKNADISKALRELGFLVEVEGGDNVQFKARAYYKAADTLASLTENVSELYASGGIDTLLQIPSIGRDIDAKIEQFVREAKIG